MCIIVDADCVHHLKGPSEHGKPVLRWLLTGRGGLIVGGENKRELARAGLRDMLVVLEQAGRLKRHDDAKVDALAASIKNAGKCCSNDVHVLALAVISGCRLLFSKDKDLHADVKNAEILSPSASIYQSKTHQHLLTECRCD